MNTLPCARKRRQILLKRASNADQIARGEAVVLPEGNRTLRIVQSEDRLVTVSDDVYMSRAPPAKRQSSERLA